MCIEALRFLTSRPKPLSCCFSIILHTPGNYGAAILTRVVQNMNADGFNSPSFTAPLSYGVLNEAFDLHGELGETVGTANLPALQSEVRKVRELSLQAVGEYYNLNHHHFEVAGLTLSKVLEEAQARWTENDATVPTHAAAIYERRPSEPLLDEIISAFSDDMTPKLRELRDYHRHIEQEVPLPFAMQASGVRWQDSPEAKSVVAKAETSGAVDTLDLVTIKSLHYAKPKPSAFFKTGRLVCPAGGAGGVECFVDFFAAAAVRTACTRTDTLSLTPLPTWLPVTCSGLPDMGEHAISYMEWLGEFKGFYEALPAADKPPFINLTIGGVFRETAPRTDVNASRGYVVSVCRHPFIPLSHVDSGVGF